MTHEEIITTIKSSEIYDQDDFDVFIDKISEAISNLEISVEQKELLIEQLLINVEQKPEQEFTSWSLVHFIEWLDEDGSTNYNTQILESLNVKPKYFTLLLANRIINSLPETSTERAAFIKALKEIASNHSLDEYYVRRQTNFTNINCRIPKTSSTVANIISYVKR